MDDDDEFSSWQRLNLGAYRGSVNMAIDLMMKARQRMRMNYLLAALYFVVGAAYTCFPFFGASPGYFGTAVIWYTGAFFFWFFMARKLNKRDAERWELEIKRRQQSLEKARENFRRENLRRFNEDARKELF